MSLLEQLPTAVTDLLQSASFCQYASVSAAGVPVDTPVLFFPSDGLRTIDIATGLSYPAKAERARRNPQVGLWIEGGADAPVVSLVGRAAVRDADLQANVDRYLSEAAYSLAHDPDWSLARQAVWYWTRMLICITPVSVTWWDSPAAMNRPPRRWDAPPDAVYPSSDPAPAGKTSKPAKWDERPWRELAGQALARGAPCHVSVVDADGYARPARVAEATISADGFRLDMPAPMPWSLHGAACLTFGGVETFIGTVKQEGAVAAMTVERTLPIFPMTQDMTQLWEPTEHTREELMRRLREETGRRGQPIPQVPAVRPEPTEGYRRRLAARASASANV